MPRPVLEAMNNHLTLESEIGGYEAAERASPLVEALYRNVAHLVGGSPDEVAFLDNATRAWHSVFHALDWKPGDEILTAQSEYNSHMISFRHAEKRFGVRIVLVPDGEDGTVDIDALGKLISPRCRLISITHLPTNDGLVNPVAEIGRIANEHGIPFLLDACQSAGQIPLDVSEIGCTMLSATGRKYLRGPRGTGFLWVRSDWMERLVPHTLDIRSARWTHVDAYEIAPDARRFELWETNVASMIGLGVATGYASATGLSAIWRRVRMLGERLRAQIAELPEFTVHDRGTQRSGIVTFSHSSLSAGEIVARLRDEHSVNTSVSATQLTRSDLVERGVTQMVRASVHAYNTEGELERLARGLHDICDRRVASGRHVFQ